MELMYFLEKIETRAFSAAKLTHDHEDSLGSPFMRRALIWSSRPCFLERASHKDYFKTLKWLAKKETPGSFRMERRLCGIGIASVLGG
jgi:hypothetical protein